MISMRSAVSRTLLCGRRTHNSGAAFFQANLPFPPSSSDTQDNNKIYNTNFVPIRNLTSPAYKRYLKNSKHGIKGTKPSIHAYPSGIQVPSLKVARDLGKSFSEIDNEPLVVIAEMGNDRAREEVLKRHIMAIESINYEQAGKIMEQIAAKNKEGLFLYKIPYQLGILVAGTTGFIVFPMVFDLEFAKWFNSAFVTMDIPQPDDLETYLETGIWTWNWMEPLMGTLTYTLVCLQLMRQQMIHLGIKPFTNYLLSHRTEKLRAAFPQYDRDLLHNYVKAQKMK